MVYLEGTIGNTDKIRYRAEGNVRLRNCAIALIMVYSGEGPKPLIMLAGKVRNPRQDMALIMPAGKACSQNRRQRSGYASCADHASGEGPGPGQANR